ncbi:thiazole synthase [Campylobacter upsaliensis]|uniref:thiazole synthase n=1 Tax=Campylobacter upsaliensis TaxID=28080 RepID=UPI0022EB6E13|nr:thiazole synthase [Campylobacter upsaliensis]MEB2791322.1 thiazole synthase [Campylobacter upsaliensis]
MQDLLKIGRFEFQSRFILGSGKYSLELINSAIEEARAEIITLALRRVNANGIENILDFIPKNITLLPNTSGARNAEEALRIARLARELCGVELIKIEVIRDSKYLLPDNYESIKAVELLAKDGFTPLPYMSADLYVARAMCDAGAAAIMPLAAPIGSNKGLCAREFIQILLNEINLPIIVDAGLGTPAQACEAMQMGVAAVMLNTALAEAKNIPLMARAFALAVEAGRAGYLAGLAKESEARASSPLTGFLRD